MADEYFVYILASQGNGTLYVGVTSELGRRVEAHKAKAVPGFTQRYGVDTLVHVEGYSSINEGTANVASNAGSATGSLS
jgi:putative endonuclease